MDDEPNVGLYRPDRTFTKDLLRQADAEMYKEKRDKNRPRVVAA